MLCVCVKVRHLKGKLINAASTAVFQKNIYLEKKWERFGAFFKSREETEM